MNTVPRLTIGLPVYNGENYVAQTIEALLGQTYEDFELIISDNASIDGTADICRHYAKSDSRVRYTRQPRNIGAAPNHNFLVREARGELFKWAGADDLFARSLVERCVAELDEHPEAVLAHSWTAAIDGANNVTQTLEYPLKTDSSSAPERFRTMLFGTGKADGGLIRADDMYGVMRTSVLRRVPQGSYYHSDRVLMTEVVLYGPFRQVPEWLYFRRDHSDRPQHATPTIRGWCANLDPRRRNKLLHPTPRLLAEFLLGYVTAIAHAPLSAADRSKCYRLLTEWILGRAAPVGRQLLGRGVFAWDEVAIPTPANVPLDKIVAGLEKEHQS
ncbi:MAG TPA: glycosyltransferase family A protein [Trebonia sp.]|nr:glycosyltransferase family A protein [Trebonia sp.]